MKANKNTIIAIFLVVLAMIGVSFFYSHRNSDGPKLSWKGTTYQHGVLLYFSKNKGSEIVTEPVSRDFPKIKPRSNPDLVAYVVTLLLNGPTPQEQSQGYFSEIPEHTKLLGVKETSGAIQVDLSQEFTSGGGSNSMLQRYQELAKTLVSIPQKKPIYLLVQGKSLETLGGEGVMIHEPVTEDPSVTQ